MNLMRANARMKMQRGQYHQRDSGVDLFMEHVVQSSNVPSCLCALSAVLDNPPSDLARTLKNLSIVRLGWNFDKSVVI